ncbi:MAG: hypothetical protein AAF995_00775 [Planctomycetota bacterium]
MQRREKTSPARPCQRCGAPEPRLYRVRLGQEPWLLVCKACWQAEFSGRAGYVYGGTWSGRDRKR